MMDGRLLSALEREWSRLGTDSGFADIGRLCIPRSGGSIDPQQAAFPSLPTANGTPAPQLQYEAPTWSVRDVVNSAEAV